MWTRRREPRAPKVAFKDRDKLDKMAVADLKDWAESCLMNAHMCYDNYSKYSDRDFIVAAIDYLYQAHVALESLAGR